MKKLIGGVVCFGAIALGGAAPAWADGAGENWESAGKLRRLDIMLMVTSLRCRTGVDDFQADFQAFEARHLAELNAANQQLAAQYRRQLGAAGAVQALDRLSVVMANDYGNGHPWLGCHELKQLAHDLAASEGAEPLAQAADAVLGGDGPRLAYVP